MMQIRIPGVNVILDIPICLRHTRHIELTGLFVKLCKFCGAEFKAIRNQVYCVRECARNAQKIYLRAYTKEWGKRNKDKRLATKRKIGKSFKGRFQSMMDNMRSRNTRLGVKLDIDRDWLMQKIQNGFCEVSGLPFDLSGAFKADFAPSVDRIKPKEPYSKDNCRVIAWVINRALSDKGLEAMCDIFQRIIDRQRAGSMCPQGD